MEHDVAVIGAGPAGSVAALLLARAGHDTILCERHAMPREKVCGDALIPDSIAVLRRLGLYDEVRALAHAGNVMRFHAPRGTAYTVDAEFLTLQRSHLDRILMDAALNAGAHSLQARATRIDPHGDGVTVSFADGKTLRARIVVIATGSDTSLLKPWLPSRPAPSAVAMRGYIHSTYAEPDLVASFDRSVRPGYGWVFPLPDGWFNVGCGYFYHGARAPTVDLRAMFDRFVRDFHIASKASASADVTVPAKGALLRCGLSGAPPHPTTRVVAIGETTGTTFPFTGEGIGKAMETAELATQSICAALAADDPALLADYAAAVNETLRPRYQFYSFAERFLDLPFVHDAVAWKAQRSAGVRRTLSRAVSEDYDTTRMITKRKALRLLLQ